MKKIITASALVATLALAACGHDNGSDVVSNTTTTNTSTVLANGATVNTSKVDASTPNNQQP